MEELVEGFMEQIENIEDIHQSPVYYSKEF